MSKLMVERGSRVSRDQVCAVQPDPSTDTYKPIPYEKIIDSIEEGIEKHLGDYKIHKAEYSLSQKDKQLFTVYSLKGPNNEHGPALGARQSYNKSIAPATAGGLAVSVCDNLMFSGDSFTFIRKNTKNVWEDWCQLLEDSLLQLPKWYANTVKDIEVLKAVPCTLEDGWRILGHATNGGNLVDDTRRPRHHTGETWKPGDTQHWEVVLEKQQMTVAANDWTTPRHSAFRSRNMWSLYNCFTEAVKIGPAGQRMKRQTNVHDYFHTLVQNLPVEVLSGVDVGTVADAI